MPVTRAVYVPSNSVAQMQAARSRRGAPPSRMLSMQELLMSPQLMHATYAAASDIAEAARAIARAEITSDSSSGAYVESIDAEAIDPVVIGGNPRVAAAVTAHGGTASWGGFTDPESSHAAVVEFGSPAAPHSGRRIFGRVAVVYSSPKRPS